MLWVESAAVASDRSTIFATYNGQQPMLERQKRLNFLPEKIDVYCVLLNYFILILHGLLASCLIYARAFIEYIYVGAFCFNVTFSEIH